MWSKQNIVMGDETNESWKWTECIHECEHSNVRTIFTHDELLSSTIDIYAMRWITFMIYLTCYTFFFFQWQKRLCSMLCGLAPSGRKTKTSSTPAAKNTVIIIWAHLGLWYEQHYGRFLYLGTPIRTFLILAGGLWMCTY